MSAETGIRHKTVGQTYSASCRAIFPGTAANLDVFKMCRIGISVSCGLIEFLGWIDLAGLHADRRFHIDKSLTLGRYHHTTATDLGAFIHANRRADNVCVGVVRKESAHKL